ncbi:class V aminotransferase [Sphingomonas sp. SM33]|uniref:Class V aminotransferase n=1 Tax=Sphingomonas telluris TaxID=2907998 RepID=A0ABS9VP93_9SPHN|nr:class V aminotransferase [Sphingomonas telluris]MCH8616800.1 class V aminotransferase [Sphingomonas telluris]
MSFKHLFSRSLGADPTRLHVAAHSHHLWPDASFDGQVECWEDAARMADRKWDRIMDEVWPEAQGHVAAELGTGMPEALVFAPNTHQLLVSLFAAATSTWPIRVLTSDGEFHSARRQFARWEEAGAATIERVPAEPFDSFSDRFLERARSGEQDFIFVSQVLFGSGRRFERVEELAELSRPEGPWVVVDGYHAFMALERPFAGSAPGSAFYLGGGYKYAMAGEGCAFLHAPPGFGERPRITGWFAEFEDLTLPPGSVGYRKDGMRFMGATFDASGLYRFNAIKRMLKANGLTTGRVSAHVEALQEALLERLAGTSVGSAERLNRPGDARFLAFRSPEAQRWSNELKARNCITDVRGDVLRIGLAIYHDEADVDAFVALAKSLT